MNNQDIKEMNNKELHATLREERKNLQSMQFSHAVTPIENPAKIKAARKVVARLMTEINARNKK